MQIPKYFYFRVKTDRKGLSLEIEDASDADVVEVVRCEKCVYWDAGTRRHNSNDVAEWDEAICDKYHEFGLSCDVWTATDDFCSYGERKGGEDGAADN